MKSNYDTAPRELAHRAGDGIEVFLLWRKEGDRVTVVVADARIDESFEFAVTPGRALDAFNHPFAYAAFHGVEYAPDMHVDRQPAFM